MSKSKVEYFIFKYLDKHIFCLRRLRLFFYFVSSIDLMVSSSYMLYLALPITTLIYSSLHCLIHLDGFQLIQLPFYKELVVKQVLV